MTSDLERNIIDRFRRIRLFAFDIDGTLTDGGIYLGDAGETKRFDVQDGAAIAILLRQGLHVAFITGRESIAVQRRAEELGVTEVHQRVKDKVATLTVIAGRLGITRDEILYMGDDLPDLAAFSHVGLAVAPGNAVPDVRARAHYICTRTGGHGAVREIVEIILRHQERWESVLAYFITHEGETAIRQ